MNYSELKGYMTQFHLGEISKNEMAVCIYLWQRARELQTVQYGPLRALIGKLSSSRSALESLHTPLDWEPAL